MTPSEQNDSAKLTQSGSPSASRIDALKTWANGVPAVVICARWNGDYNVAVSTGPGGSAIIHSSKSYEDAALYVINTLHWLGVDVPLPPTDGGRA